MNALQKLIQSAPCGFITQEIMAELIKLSRLHPVLVRCGCCRFTCVAQDFDHLSKCIDAGGDYVRDASFPSGSLLNAAGWCFRPEGEARRIAFGCTPEPVEKPAPKPYHGARFDESQCSGVFDGFGVVSDADPGL